MASGEVGEWAVGRAVGSGSGVVDSRRVGSAESRQGAIGWMRLRGEIDECYGFRGGLIVASGAGFLSGAVARDGELVVDLGTSQGVYAGGGGPAVG